MKTEGLDWTGKKSIFHWSDGRPIEHPIINLEHYCAVKRFIATKIQPSVESVEIEEQE